MIIHTPVLEQNKTLYRCHIKFSLSLFNFVNKFSMYLQNFVSDVCMHVYMYVMAWLKVFDIGCMCSIWNLLLYFIKYMYITDIWSWQTERGRNRLIEYLNCVYTRKTTVLRNWIVTTEKKFGCFNSQYSIIFSKSVVAV